jgi:rhodanese-related sulfurtransferase
MDAPRKISVQSTLYEGKRRWKRRSFTLRSQGMLGNPDLVIFDVRLGSDYFSSDLKIKGAVRPDMGTHITITVFTYPKGKTFVFYCASPNEERSVYNVKYLIERYRTEGYTKAYVLKGGWEEWLKANYPTEKK